MQCILGPTSTLLENTEPLQLPCVRLDPKPYFLQNDLLEYKGHFSGMVSLFRKQNTTIIHRTFSKKNQKNPKTIQPQAPIFLGESLPDPLDFTTFTSMAFLLLVPFPSHLDEGLQGDREMKPAHPECQPLQSWWWRKQPDHASLSTKGQSTGYLALHLGHSRYVLV